MLLKFIDSVCIFYKITCIKHHLKSSSTTQIMSTFCDEMLHIRFSLNVKRTVTIARTIIATVKMRVLLKMQYLCIKIKEGLIFTCQTSYLKQQSNQNT